jgi:hypothetical protein
MCWLVSWQSLKVIQSGGQNLLAPSKNGVSNLIHPFHKSQIWGQNLLTPPPPASKKWCIRFDTPISEISKLGSNFDLTKKLPLAWLDLGQRMPKKGDSARLILTYSSSVYCTTRCCSLLLSNGKRQFPGIVQWFLANKVSHRVRKLDWTLPWNRKRE